MTEDVQQVAIGVSCMHNFQPSEFTLLPVPQHMQQFLPCTILRLWQCMLLTELPKLAPLHRT